ncbi:TetR/AcrR family transcriptional regulator [Limnobacter humi]|uniref:TetR/AcrR family transcriptional regulator n=1 Tax=Limnobacter humi TaxID=1778671 RepID=A0ABT1WBR6_9BURK|nr:TetR/AcrR family transcriptional regulator [Limnobacter humi]MCQ8894958.1 TetR/AcrR family transcriptional regulator [Limnobacter humi]
MTINPHPSSQRKQAAIDHRRSLILDAARAVFREQGLEAASLREIAKRAGYTPGAIYSYFPGKEDMYGALLAESLQRLQSVVEAAAVRPRLPLRKLQAAALAFYQFYADHPQDLELGFYLFNGLKPQGLNKNLNAALNAGLLACLQPIQSALQSQGLSEDKAIAETTALFAHSVGLLMLQHTGRIRLFGQNPAQLFEAHLGHLLNRLAATT